MNTEVQDSTGGTPESRSGRSRPLVWIELVLLVCLVVGFAVKGLVPAWQHLGSDFPNYYLVARLYHEGYPLDRIYEWTWLQRQKDHAGIEQGRVGFAPSTFPSALPVWLWCTLPPLQAKHWWLGANLAFLLLIGGLLTRMTKLGWVRVALLMFLMFIPLRSNFLLGQMHLLVLLLLTLAAWLYFGKRPFLSGLSLAIAAALKLYPALFLIYFLGKKQWRAAAGLLVGLVGAGVASIHAFGTDACVLYVREILPAGLRGEYLDPYNTGWNSWTALLRRLFIAEPELNPTPVAHIPWLYALLHPLVHGIILVAFVWAICLKRRDDDGDAKLERIKLEWAAYVFMLLFLSSLVGTYHLVALILSGALLTNYLVARKQWTMAGAAVIFYALIGGPLLQPAWASPTGWYSLLFFSRLLFMTLLSGVLLGALLPRGAELRALFKFRSVALPASTLIVLVVAGFISTVRHLDGQFDNYKARIAAVPGDLFAGNPSLASGGLLFTGMTGEGYMLRRLQAEPGVDSSHENFSILDLPRMGSDWFHPTAPELSDSVWVEQAWAEQTSRGDSRVVRFPNADLGKGSVSVTTEVEDAEEPIVSPDGQMLGFLRDVRGRSSLWIQTITATGGAGVAKAAETGAREIAGPDYDVRDATFALEHRIIFSSKRTGRFALYVATPSGDVQQMAQPACSVRYPAMSPDGRSLAFSCEQGGNWRLYAMDLQGSQEIQLSAGECNSISPAWTADSKRVIYASDCGRGLGLTALAEATVVH